MSTSSRPASVHLHLSAGLALLIASLFVPAAAIADPGDVLTSFGNGGVALEGSTGVKPVLDAMHHPDHGLLLAVRHVSDQGDIQIRLLQMDVASGIVLSSQVLPPAIEDGLEVHMRDDGLGGLIVGATVVGASTARDVLIFRLDSGLALDAGFGWRQVGFDLPPYLIDDLEDLEILSDGRIVALTSQSTGEGNRVGLIFLNSDGSLDQTVPGAGYVLVAEGLGGDLGAEAMAVDSLDRLWIGTRYSGPNLGKIAVLRILPNGTLDINFAIVGATTLEVRDCPTCPADTTAYFQDLKVLLDRPYVLATVRNADLNDDPTVARVTDHGDIDPLFGGWTRILFAAPPASTDAGDPLPVYRFDLEVDAARRGIVVAAGGEDPGSGPAQDYLGIARLNVQGEFDTAFGDGGKAVRSFGMGSRFTDPFLVVLGVDPIAGSMSSLRTAIWDGGANDVAVMALEGFPVDLFTDGFESGGLTAWSAHVP